MKGENEADLLDDIRRLSGCDFISDLRFLRRGVDWKMVRRRLKVKKYGLAEWEEAIAYVTGKKLHISNYGELANQMKRMVCSE